MEGLQLGLLTGKLKKVKRNHRQPARTVVGTDKKLGPWKDYMVKYHGRFSFLSDFHKLPFEALGGFNFDELCKLYYSPDVSVDTSVDKLFETEARFEVIRKIQSSMWRWGLGRGAWNEVVDAYDGLRRFTFVADPSFEMRLDYTTGWNQFGRTKYSRVFSDGVFAYLVYYKQAHVMTVGFSIMERRRLLIQQVQSARRSGNRYLYRLPRNRLEFVINLFRTAFPSHRLYVIDGESLVEKTLADYRRQLDETRRRRDRYQRELETSEDAARSLADSESWCLELEEKISHLQTDAPRLISFYKKTGQFVLGRPAKKINGLTHWPVVNKAV